MWPEYIIFANRKFFLYDLFLPKNKQNVDLFNVIRLSAVSFILCFVNQILTAYFPPKTGETDSSKIINGKLFMGFCI